MKRVQDKNPSNKNGATPLHFAAKYGHFDVCRIILDMIDDKNPSDYKGSTPMHEAAHRGHVNICQLIFEKIAESGLRRLRSSQPVKKVYGINPGNDDGLTPLLDPSPQSPKAGGTGASKRRCW